MDGAPGTQRAAATCASSSPHHPPYTAASGHHTCSQQRDIWDFGDSVGYHLPEPVSYKQVETTTLGKNQISSKTIWFFHKISFMLLYRQNTLGKEGFFESTQLHSLPNHFCANRMLLSHFFPWDLGNTES